MAPPAALAETSKLASSPKRQAILVLGMHRSGTSALAGVISMLGVAGPKTLQAPTSDNSRGYFESPAIYGAHDDMLAAAGSCWHDWRQFNPQWNYSEAAGQFRQKIKALIVEEFGDAPLIFIKDPRICRFVPFMSSILAELNVTPVAILPMRNPLEVAYSLKRREGFALAKSILLWLRHVLDAEFHSRHMPRCFLQYEKLLIDWRYDMDRAAEMTGVTWPDRSESSAVKVDEFLEPDLRRERHSFHEIKDHPEVPLLVRETYNILTNIVAGGENTEFLEQLDVVRVKFDEGCDIFGAAAAEELAVQRLRGELNTRNAQAEQFERDNLTLATSLEQQSAEICRSTMEREALVAANDSLITERGNLIVERDRLAAAHDSLMAERGALAAVRNDLTAERDALAAVRNDLTAERDALAGVCNSLIAERDAMRASRSWRLTAPLRKLFAR
jgi:hypothetical protein